MECLFSKVIMAGRLLVCCTRLKERLSAGVVVVVVVVVVVGLVVVVVVVVEVHETHYLRNRTHTRD